MTPPIARRRSAFGLSWLSIGSLVGCCSWGASGEAWRPGYLFISSPETGTVYYSKLPSLGTLAKHEKDRPSAPRAKVLIDGGASQCRGTTCSEDSDQGLKKPTGLALHQGHRGNTLYVSDIEATNIYAYEIAGGAGTQEGDSPIAIGRLFGYYSPEVVVGKQRRVRTGIDGGANCLAVDGEGNLFYATGQGKVEMISADGLQSGSATGMMAVVLYSAQNTQTIAGPSGITTDGFHLYWANQNGGGESGTVASAVSRPGAVGAGSATTPKVLADNLASAYGVCSARGTIFFSAEKAGFYAVKSSGGAIAEVSKAFAQPRGCASDGGSTLYVADAEDEAVYSLVAVSNLRAVRHVSKVASVASPSQVAVYWAVGGRLKGAPLSSAGGLLPSFGAFLIVVVGIVAALD